jgi:nucleotide-binding universal stress UspA family protein
VVDMTVSSEGRHGTTASTNTPARIMVGVDGSSAGRAALGAARVEALTNRLHVVAVHVRRGLTPLEALGSGFAGLAGACWLDCRDDAELSAWLDCVQVLEATGLSWEFVVREGEPAEQLRTVATQLPVRTIYLATRPRPWWRRGLHHCPARALSRRARCPVRVVSYSAE